MPIPLLLQEEDAIGEHGALNQRAKQRLQREEDAQAVNEGRALFCHGCQLCIGDAVGRQGQPVAAVGRGREGGR